MYSTGTGVSQNYAETFKWMNKAASNGNLRAQLLVATMYSMGRGTDKNLVESYKWFTVVLTSQSEFSDSDPGYSFGVTGGVNPLVEDAKINKLRAVAGDLRKKISELMTAGQIEDAQHHASEWKWKRR